MLVTQTVDFNNSRYNIQLICNLLMPEQVLQATHINIFLNIGKMNWFIAGKNFNDERVLDPESILFCSNEEVNRFIVNELIHNYLGYPLPPQRD